MKLSELFYLAKTASIKAGEFLLKNKDVEKKVFLEQGRDIKLEIDRSTEKLIRTILEVSEIPIIGEEYGGDVINDKEDYWVIDPLDGTSNYFRGIDQCCVSISLMNGLTSKIGIIHNFNTSETFTALQGQGSYLNDVKIKVSQIHTKSSATLTTGFPASESFDSENFSLNSFKEWKKVRMFGSAALSCAYIASGRCDVYQEKGVYLWDFAAGICLVEEAGGKAVYKKIDDSRYLVNFSNGKL